METQLSSDFRETEKIFKKVVYPGLETLKVVDRNGVPISYQGFNSMHSKSFILSPRGVPMKTPNHVYSGCHTHQAKPINLVDRPPSPETFYGPEKNFLTKPKLASYSAKLPRRRNESPLQQKKRAATSQSVAPKHVSKSLSAGHFLSSEAQEKRILQSANNTNCWNLSHQSLRLQREWTSLSNTRSIKRASEIVDHRVDRMYFMSGNSIKLKPRYDVDDDELTRMKEMQAKNKETAYKRSTTRASSRNSIKSEPKKILPIDLKKTIGHAESEETVDHTTSSGVNLKKPDGTMSPIHGWEAKDSQRSREEHVLIRQKSLHEDDKVNTTNENNKKSGEIVQNGDSNQKDSDELQETRPDGRIDSSDLNNEGQGEISEQKVTVEGQEEITKDEVTVQEEGEITNGNVAQENT